VIVGNAEYDGHERVIVLGADVLGVPAVIAVHRTVEGRSGGGVRFRPYASEDDAVTDALRLSRAMSYKMALADVPIGGGKAVILGDSRIDKTEELMLRLGGVVESMSGVYIAGPDVGTTPADMGVINRATDHVIGVPERGFDTAGPTVRGVLCGIHATVEHVYGVDALDGLTIAVQGLGGVGRQLCESLAAEGANLVVADIDENAVSNVIAITGADRVSPDEFFAVRADLLVPAALGGVLSAKTIPTIRSPAICGPANNQLAEEGDADRLQRLGITFAPDYVVNSGGAISAALELGLIDAAGYEDRIEGIGRTLGDVLSEAAARSITPTEAAIRLAKEKIARYEVELVVR
jgi:leucine dehydrogenase